jgi:hypothetical protein
VLWLVLRFHSHCHNEYWHVRQGRITHRNCKATPSIENISGINCKKNSLLLLAVKVRTGNLAGKSIVIRLRLKGYQYVNCKT